jgi:filamentous hemagglutinin family protein
MNRNRYRLVFNTTLGMMVPVAETARRQGKAASGSALVLASVLLAGPSWAELPVASVNFAAPGTTASYQASGTQAYVSQVGSKAIVNFQTGNISAGHDLQFRQVDSLLTNNLVPGANFSVLARIHDINPSVIAGSISQAVGQKANVTMVNTNGIAFMGGSEVNLNSFTASSLNIQDSFLDNFLPGTDAAQFENTEADGAARGFVKVFEGAKITAGSQGRVMLIAPTVVNKGTVTAPDGQVIAAAGAKVYLRSAGIEDTNVRGLLVEVDSPADLADFDTANPDVKDGELDGQAVSLANAAEDKLGHVTNLGELTTPRGNVTMVGYAVNQLGIARATTSVVSNGSVYLLAKDTKATSVIPIPGSLADISSARAGRVLLGENSLTEIKPEVADSTTGLDGTTGAGLAKASLVKVLGEDIRMASGAEIDAPAAQVEFLAIEHPNDPLVLMQAGKTASDRARIHIAGGARIDVAGLENVAVSAARNSVEVELRGDELKDSPVNQQGPLRGEKVYVDINRALANADAGKSTLIASDSLDAYQAKLERGVAERSTAGGTVRLLSEGETILENGAVFDLSGGSVSYTAANVKTTLLTTGGKLVDLADANAETRYDGIATRYVRDYGRWNRKEVIDLGQSFRYDPGYVEGKDAGSLDVIGMKAVVMQADIQGRTTTGELQREAGTSPEGARLRLGSDAVVDIGGGGLRDYKLNQRVEVSSNGVALPEDFKFGDALAQDLKDTLALNPALMGKDKVAQLEVFSNQAAEVREALRMPAGGSVSITAEGVAVKADIQAASGEILLAATQNALNGVPASLDVTVADGVTLSARGGWANDLPGATGKSADAAKIDGGLIALTAVGGDVVLGESTLVDVSGGARVKPDGKLKNGNGGNVTLESGRALKLGGEVRGYALGKGGTYKLKAQKIQIGGAPVADALNLDAAFFERGGFADFSLTGSDGVDIADGTVLRPTAINRELLAAYALQPTGSDIGAFSRLVKQDDYVRQAANVSFSTTGIGTKIRLGENAKILADDQAKISFRAPSRVELLGEVRAAGGSISANVSSSQFDSSEAVWLGSNGVLDVAGVARTYLDSRGLTQGEVLGGGKVTLGGTGVYVVTEEGSRIDVSGAAPVRLDVHNEAGGLGRDVGSDAGSVTIATTEGALLDGTIAAHAGSAANRGGAFNLKLDDTRDRTLISGAPPVNGRVLNLASTLAPQVAGLEPGDTIPLALNGNTRVSTQAIEAAGFDRVAYTSETGMIRLENGLNVGAGRAMPLRELSLNAPRIETVGGDATLTADAVRLGNYGEFTDTAPAAPTTSGTFTVNARQIELAGKLALEGMAQAVLNGEEAIRLVGGFPESRVEGQHKIDLRPVGELKTGANLVFHGAVVAPASYVQYSILAPGKTVRFTQGGAAPNQPLSAFGSLTVEAKDIAQGGSIWAPLGKINLLATDTLTFENGSLTSAAADASSLLPFGKILNGRTWTFDLNADETDSIEFADTPEQKSILAQAAKVNMQPGARVDLGGGGDAQAYEFSVGPGGSRDILADRNTYAILPGFKGGFAPGDAQEKFDRASGEAVYLSGVPGLADGVYTLLPAHYALLPGAYAVKLDTGIADVLPGQAYSRQDGVRIAAGYVTDTRAGAPRDANWQGVQVLTHDQVRARSEFTLTRASEFFADSRIRPQDAGLLSVSTSGSGADALKFDAIYDFAAGKGGRGAQVDINALKLAVTSGSPAGLDPDAVVLDVGTLNSLGADSLFIGGTRAASGDTTTLTVGATTVTLANDAEHALRAGEVMLAATDTLALESGSAVDAQGAPGDVGAYETSGNGAFVRAASTSASFTRTVSPDRSQGTLTGAADSTVIAADSITLDATRENAFKGATRFEKEQTGTAQRAAVPGTLAVGATRINFGAAPVGAEGIAYSQAELDAFASLKGLALTSYSSFDLYGGVKVGGLIGNKPTLQNLTLQGAGLAGIDNAGKTAELNAQNLTLANPAASTFAAGGLLGSGTLAVTADTLVLGEGGKAVEGFGAVNITANELVGSGTGTLDTTAPVTLNVARIRGERGADQAFNSTGAMAVAQHRADRALAPVGALGAKWALQGTSVDFDSHAELPSGSFKLTATTGDVTLGANARVDVAGREVQFFDVKKPSWGGTAEFVSETGNVTFDDRALRNIDLKDIAQVDVSAAAGGDAGTLIVRAANGTFTMANGSVQGQASKDADDRRGEGARAEIDVKTLAGFSALNTALNGPERIEEGVAVYDGFDGARALRVRTGDVSIAGTDSVRAHEISIAADGGKLDVQGTLDASGEDAGRIELFAKGDVNVLAGAELLAHSTGAGEDGGDIEIGSAKGTLNFASHTMKVQGGSGGAGGTVLLRALRTGPVDAETEVAVKAFDSAGTEITTNALGSVGINGTLTGARSISVEAVKVYQDITTLTATDNSPGNLGLDKVTEDNAKFAGNVSSNPGANYVAIKTRLGKTDDLALHILSGVEVRSTGDLTLAQDWNLKDSRAGGESGVLTLRAASNLNVNANLSDGFGQVTPMKSGSNPADLLAGNSWSYRLVAGADAGAADPLAVKPAAGSMSLAANKLIRTGTGDIRVASGGNIALGNDKSVIYTAGRRADAIAGFTDPKWSNATLIPNFAQFSQGGGDVSIVAQGNIAGVPSAQLINNWLFRQGRLDTAGTAYAVQPAWWVRFDQFRQGVGALGGGDVTIKAGGNIENLPAHTPTQARMASATPDAGALVQTGGGTVRMETGGDILGGQYYADRGDVVLKAGGKVDSGGQMNSSGQLIYTVLALGDGEARVSAQGDANINAVFNPTLFDQSSSTGSSTAKSIYNVTNNSGRDSAFSTYTDASAASLQSLSGAARLHSVDSLVIDTPLFVKPLNDNQSPTIYGLDILPPSLSMVAFQGDATISEPGSSGSLVMISAPHSTLEVLARGTAALNQTLVMSDRAPTTFPNVVFPVNPQASTNPITGWGEKENNPLFHAPEPVHAIDLTPVRIYAVEGDIVGGSAASDNATRLDIPKAFVIQAGRDVKNVSIEAQHVNANNAESRVQAGRDVTFATGIQRTEADHIHVGGSGSLDVIAGRDIDLGTSGGILSRGNTANPALAEQGADIRMAAGVGAAGVDYGGAVDRLLAKLDAGETDDATLWQARWLTGDVNLTADNARAAVQAVDAQDSHAQEESVRTLLFAALRETGRDSNKSDSPYAGDYARGYAALDLVFPGIGEKNPDGGFDNYQGGINLFASRVKTESGGNIEWIVPGGDMVVGLANTPKALVDTGTNVLGVVAAGEGDIKGFSRGDVLVNQSRILTVGGGDVLLWSSEGDIDAGKGKKTAVAVPPPLILVDSKGNVTQVLQGAASGSGIGALTPAAGTAGDVDLIAPKGTVNAGDAGIRAGNLNIAAQVVLGADNISVSGSSAGTPVADTSAVTAASSGATNAGDVSSTTAALSQNLADAARAAEELKQAFKPTFISAEVIGHGE